MRARWAISLPFMYSLLFCLAVTSAWPRSDLGELLTFVVLIASLPSYVVAAGIQQLSGGLGADAMLKLWFAFGIAQFALIGACVDRQKVDNERMARGLCLKCGYDLRGLRDPRCPECGTHMYM